MQELGPRFTLKMKWMQKGLWQPQKGEMEWQLKVIISLFGKATHTKGGKSRSLIYMSTHSRRWKRVDDDSFYKEGE